MAAIHAIDANALHVEVCTASTDDRGEEPITPVVEYQRRAPTPSHRRPILDVMKDIDRVLADLAATQHGVLSRSQARAAGLSASALSRRVSRGDLIAVGPASLRLPGRALGWRGKLSAGLLDLGPGALVSGAAAAQLFGLDGFDGDRLGFLVPRELRNRTTSGRVTSSSDINRLDRVVVDGLPCTSPTRTVIELLRSGPIDEASLALDSACRKRLTAHSVVRRRLSELGTRGRAGVAAFDELTRAGSVESWLERRFVDVLASS